MNRHLQKILSDLRDIARQTKVWFLELPRWKQGAVIAVILVAIFFIHKLGGKSPEDEAVRAPRVVTLASVSSLANMDSSLPLLGTVTSTSEATIRSESSGKLTRVYKKLGDHVVAGEVIAEFENSAERAAVLQAEGAYDAAKTSREIASINSGTSASSLGEAKTGALNTINNAYFSMDDVIHARTDSAYVDPRTENVHWNILVPDSMLTLSLEAQRKAIEKILINREAHNKTLTVGSDLISELNATQNEAQSIKTYLDDMATAYSKALPDNNYSQTAIDAGKSSVSSARSTIAATLSSIAASRSTLNGAVAGAEVAGKTSGTTGGTAVATADANVKQALGAYDAALSRLEKTVIRSPITGTLNSLSIQTGDFISAFNQVAVVSNNGALEVLAYVTDDDAKRVQVGNEVMIDNTVKGIITRIASAIDPLTKKIEVRIGITDKQASLVNGQAVRVTITKSKQTITATSSPIKIPLSALKLTPDGAFVFTTSATSSLIAIPVKEGAILGDDIQILSGLEGSETIVTDARGLKEGAVVTVKE
jgi:multidrug efflux pump subunit AcrA (membrane-fusion protein)